MPQEPSRSSRTESSMHTTQRPSRARRERPGVRDASAQLGITVRSLVRGSVEQVVFGRPRPRGAPTRGSPRACSTPLISAFATSEATGSGTPAPVGAASLRSPRVASSRTAVSGAPRPVGDVSHRPHRAVPFVFCLGFRGCSRHRSRTQRGRAEACAGPVSRVGRERGPAQSTGRTCTAKPEPTHEGTCW
jgi:hypothetical protein